MIIQFIYKIYICKEPSHISEPSNLKIFSLWIPWVPNINGNSSEKKILYSSWGRNTCSTDAEMFHPSSLILQVEVFFFLSYSRALMDIRAPFRLTLDGMCRSAGPRCKLPAAHLLAIGNTCILPFSRVRIFRALWYSPKNQNPKIRGTFILIRFVWFQVLTGFCTCND